MEKRFKGVLLALGAFGEERGQPGLAGSLYERTLEVSPTSEDCYRRLMACQDAMGLRAEAIATYRRCQRALLHLVGIEPSGKTRELFQQLLRPPH